MDTKSARSQLKKLLKLLKTSNVVVQDILIFGSHARGLATKSSDLDVCLIFSDKIKTAAEQTALIRFKLGRMALNIDLSSLYFSELKKNRLSSFVNEIKTSSIKAEVFLVNPPKTLN